MLGQKATKRLTESQLGHYVDAARKMKARQLLHRARRPLPHRALAIGLNASSPPPGWRPLAAGAGVDAAPMFGPAPSPHGDGIFRAGDRARTFGSQDFWIDESDGLLFLFHLHGFSELARYCADRPSPDGDAFWGELVSDWLSLGEFRPRPAWHPYPLSGRIIAWCAALSREDDWLAANKDRMLRSLWLQLRLLARSLEHDIGGNHVLRNAVALVVGGACLESAKARDRGLRLLETELETQVLDDGLHEERSTSYQRAIIGDLEDAAGVLARSGMEVPPWLGQGRERLVVSLSALAGPDGDLPALNDGWDGPPLALGSERPAVQDLEQGGYVSAHDGDVHAVLDVGSLAPRHLPAHAHADALSFVLWAGGTRVVVDPGSGAYAGADRDRFRATRAHNTVELDGQDQCAFWGTFRASRLPLVQRSPIERRDGAVILRASHDGYRRLQDPAVHERTFLWLGADGLIVIDRLIAARRHPVLTRLHLAEGLDDPLGEPLPGGLRLRALGVQLSEPRCQAGERAPYIGVRTPITIVERGGEIAPGVPFGWALTGDRVRVSLQPGGVEVTRPGRPVCSVSLE